MTHEGKASRVGHGSRAPQRTGPDDALNAQIQALLRDAAEAIAERTRVQAASDAEAAERQLDEILALARGKRR